MTIESAITELWTRYDEDSITAEDVGADELATLEAFLEALEEGTVRAATPTGTGETPRERWEAQTWVKQGILLNFALRETTPQAYGGVTYHDVLPLRRTDDLPGRGTRNTPDGTTIRRGAYVGGDAILMSPSFLNIGAYVGDGTLVDSCDTVGSCAQLGNNVKLGANTLVGGVLEPVEETPVIIEDDVSIGAGCRITSGFVVGEGAVVGENTLLTPRIPVYDLVESEVVYGYVPAGRRVMTRFVRSSVSDHELFEETEAYKPAVVATDPAEHTHAGAAREETLRE